MPRERFTDRRTPTSVDGGADRDGAGPSQSACGSGRFLCGGDQGGGRRSMISTRESIGWVGRRGEGTRHSQPGGAVHMLLPCNVPLPGCDRRKYLPPAVMAVPQRRKPSAAKMGADACVRVLMVGYQGGCSAGHCRDGARRATAAAAAAASNATIGVRRTACSECTKTAIKASVEPISTSQCGTREISSHDGNDLWSCADIFGRRPRIRRLGHRLNRKQIPEQYSSIR